MLTTAILVIIALAYVVAYQYICDLRRELKAARADAAQAWKHYEIKTIEVSTLQGRPGPPAAEDQQPKGQPEDDDKRDRGFRPRRIGPTAILDREMEAGRIDAGLRTPGGYTPNQDQVMNAVREARSNGELK